MKEASDYQKLIDRALRKSKDWRQEAKETWQTYTAERRFNILYSNTDLLLGALANNNPRPVIRVRFAQQSRQDDAARNLSRTAAEAAERAVVYNNERLDLKNILQQATLEALISGRGILRVAYDVQIVKEVIARPIITPQGAIVGQSEETVERIGKQDITLQSVAYDAFLCADAKRWEEVWWVAFRHLMDRTELRDKFGAVADEVPLSFKEENDPKDTETQSAREVAEVWEVWDKRQKEVVFVVRDFGKVLSREDDPYGLEGFFPLTRPLQFVKGRDLTPVPEYRLYRKTAQELTRVTKRIDELVENIRAKALYSADFKDEMAALKEATDNTDVPVNVNFGALAQNGGISSLIAEYPNAGKSQVLGVLEQRKQSAVAEIYQITGIADILRGVSDPQETAQAQRIKGEFGSVRLKARQSALQYFIRDAMRLCAELVCEHYTLENLQRVCALDLPTPEEKETLLAQAGQNVPPVANKPTWTDVLTVLRSERLRNCTFDIESTATAFDQTQQDKEARVGLFGTVQELLNKALPFMQANPEFIDAIKANVLFAVDAFPQSRTLKEAYENAFAAWEVRVKAPKPQQPTPEQMLAQAEQLKAQAEIMSAQARAAEAQVKLAQAGEKINLDKARLFKDSQKDAAELALESRKQAADEAAQNANAVRTPGGLV